MSYLTRRTILGGLAASAAPLPALAAVTDQGANLHLEGIEDPCEYHRARLVEELEKRTGGNWDIEVNPERGTVFGRRFPALPAIEETPEQKVMSLMRQIADIAKDNGGKLEFSERSEKILLTASELGTEKCHFLLAAFDK